LRRCCAPGTPTLLQCRAVWRERLICPSCRLPLGRACA
jgi:hypothetical protein